MGRLLNLYFNPTGRIKRSTWWLNTIILWVGAYVFPFAMGFMTALVGIVTGTLTILEAYEIAAWVSYGGVLLIIWSWAALSVKRLHDTERSAWWMLLWIATIIGFVIWIVMVGFL